MVWDRSNVSSEWQPPGSSRRKPGLMRVNPEDLDHVLLLYKLLEERAEQQSLGHTPMPTFSEHAGFVQGRPYLAWYFIIGNEGTIVGSIYISRQREIGLSIFREHQRQGHGGAAVREVMRIHQDDDRPFLANVDPGNDASRKFWESLGFNLYQVTYARA